MSRIIHLDYEGNDISDEYLEDTENVSEEDIDDSDVILTDLNTAIVLTIPGNTTKIKLELELLDEDNNIIKVGRTMLLPEIVEARIDGSYWADENVKYNLVDACQLD